MQLKDIPDELIYWAIKEKNRKNEEAYEQWVPGYNTAPLNERLELLMLTNGDPLRPESKNVPDMLPQFPEKLVWKKMEKMCDQDKLEYGTSIRSAWIVGD